MKASHEANAPSRFWSIFFGALLAAASMAILIFYIDAFATDVLAASATYSHGVLHVAIPYRAPHAGTGQLAVEVLNPEDETLGHSERRVEVAAGKGSWQEDRILE